MDFSDREYLLGFSFFPDIGPRRISILLNYFGTAVKIWNATEAQLLETNLPPRIVFDFIKFRSQTDLTKTTDILKRKRIGYMTFKDGKYPGLLKQIPDPPVVLFYRGNADILSENMVNVAIVGTRTATSYGIAATQQIANELVNSGVTIVSGLALGIDTAAHQTATIRKGATIAVLGSGIDRIYPPANYELYWQIIRGGGLVVSEYPPGLRPSKTTFPLRNRIISGLSKAVIVVEGKKTSGALITAKYALDQGREVFAVPGPVNSPMSTGTSYLLKNGANVATGAGDILNVIIDK